MRFFDTFFGTLLLLLACNAPQRVDNCHKLPVNESLPEPLLQCIKVNGEDRSPEKLFLKATEEDLLIELQQQPVDSYYFQLKIKDLSPCGIKTAFPQMHYTFLPGGAFGLEYWTQKGAESSVHKTLYFKVDEALTEKGWFLPLLWSCVFLVAGVLAYFWSLSNIRQRLDIQQIRSRIAADLHDEVSSDLSSIVISMTTLERRDKSPSMEFISAMRDIKQTLTDTQDNLSDTVWAIKPDKDSDGELFQRMRKFAQQMFITGDTSLIFRNSIPPDKPSKITMEQRHNVFKIFKEAIHNIYKHACATQVEINIFPHPDGIGMEIIDNGIGFDPKAEYEGNGVGNYQWRAKESFIEFELKSAPGEGTTIHMIIPQF